MAAYHHPFESLTPQRIVEAIEALGMWLPGEPFTLNSYENRVFLVSDDERRRWVVKFYRPNRWSEAQIREEHGFLTELAAAEVPVAAPWQDARGETLHEAYGFRFALFPHVPGQAPELENPEHLFALGELIGRLHAVSACCSFFERPCLDPEALVTHSREQVLAGAWLNRRQRQSYAKISEALQRLLVERTWPAGAEIRAHGDCHLGNILGRDQDFTLVDFDDCCMAPAVQDLWMMLTAQNDQELQMQLGELIEGYEQHRDFDRRQLEWIEPLRTLRLMRHSAWLVARWEDPAFPRAFPWVASEDYWDQHIRTLEQQRVVLDGSQRWLANN
ncbi:serine/threonine protein kinase [Halomonas sp. McH1-25]|uniref:serine/threonine protein kinase n=1 Tax=unclassified Halomonas TaxID=2609666 RepID=UPI001EF5F6F7|nr:MULTISPECIES: serine/threonine protein kinase [unclassified Halomonas]MCG7599131.1 serine/threonine protein kinase [Halomonas sp. McH1-25]MCP1343599.1 serine/threonine protein kinase [Halomonas sp. FL8]MCP1361081.1 serine/threonine protein kinase [Halomonas sp. BBD45]